MELTRDTFFDGKLCLYQPLTGYRSSIDSLLLFYFSTQGKRVHEALDIGSGCGIVGLSLLLCHQAETVTALELQPELFQLSQKNSSENSLADFYTPLLCDFRSVPSNFLVPPRFGLVVMNPPFWPKNHRLPTHPQKRNACHELNGSISDWIGFAAKAVESRRGRICIVFPSRRLNALYKAFDRHRLSCIRLQLVYSFSNRNAELVLVEARPRVSTNLHVLPPLVLKSSDGEDTEIAKSIMKGDFHPEILRRPDRRLINLNETSSKKNNLVLKNAKQC